MKKVIFTLAISAMFMSGYANNCIETEPSTTPPTTQTYKKAQGINSFCRAILKGDIEIVKQLIELGEDVNQRSLGKTPAMYAARYNKAEILKLLIEKGADLSLQSDPEKFKAEKFAELSHANEALAVIKASGKK